MKILFPLLSSLAVLALAIPAEAHHGKDFLLTETDDMPLPSHVYFIGSIDTNIEKDGARSTEITPGLLFGKGKFAFEPHFHLARAGAGSEDTDSGFHYDAAAFEVRYRVGELGNSGVRFAVSGEYEKPHDGDESSNGGGRLIFVKTYPHFMAAVNLLADKELSSGGDRSYGMALGALAPLANGNRVGVEVLSRFPLHDGVEVVPGYYMSVGKSKRTAFKIGPGYYYSSARKAGTLHLQFSQRF